MSVGWLLIIPASLFAYMCFYMLAAKPYKCFYCKGYGPEYFTKYNSTGCCKHCIKIVSKPERFTKKGKVCL